VRFGTFEYFYYNREYDKLHSLAEYVIEESFPHLQNDEERLLKMFCEVVDKTAILIAQWQGIGFNHGVMNTDNMSIAGLTIDYGPFAMMDDFNFGYICNCSDTVGRYSYAEQPNVAYWNLTMLAKALSPIISKDKMDKKLEEYGDSLYPNAYIKEMCAKIGLSQKLDSEGELVEELVIALHDAFVDYTLFFRTLSRYDGNREDLYDIAMNPVAIDKWLVLYDKRLLLEESTYAQRTQTMLQKNPKYVLKNHMIQEAIVLAEEGNFSKVEELLYIAAHPYDELPEYEHFAGDTPEEYKNIGLSCSS
ncbi:YdiU family protein, partial [Sulfurimonas sp. SAG-AH-194-C20]